VNGCELIQDRCEALSLSPSTLIMILSKEGVQDAVVKKSTQMKFSAPNTLYVFPQVQKLLQDAMTTSCKGGFSNQITSNVYGLDIEGLNDNGYGVDYEFNGNMVCEDIIIVGKGVWHGSVNFAALVKLSKVSIITIMNKYAYLSKDKTFHSSAPCNVIAIKSIIVCPSLPYVIAITRC